MKHYPEKALLGGGLPFADPDPKGGLWVWGQNTYGQLGLGDTVNRSSPVQVGAAQDWVRVAVCTSNIIALKSNGTLWAIGGRNNFGQLGLNNTTMMSSPVQVGSLFGWVEVTSGLDCFLAIGPGASGTTRPLSAWGSNSSYQLGDGTSVNKSSPVQMGGLTYDWQSVNGGSQATCAIKQNGTLWSWGTNGVPSSSLSRSSPAQVGAATNWSTASVSKNGGHTMFLKTDGTLWGLGLDFNGQLGDGHSGVTSFQSSPVQIGSLTNWTSVKAGYDSTSALNLPITVVSGNVKLLSTWGHNDVFQLAASAADRSSPLQVGTATWWSFVHQPGKAGYAINYYGQMFRWGQNNAGQLGNGNTTNVSIPTIMDAFGGWKTVASDGYAVAAIRKV